MSCLCNGRGWTKLTRGVDNLLNDYDGWYLEKVPCECQEQKEITRELPIVVVEEVYPCPAHPLGSLPHHMLHSPFPHQCTWRLPVKCDNQANWYCAKGAYTIWRCSKHIESRPK